MTCSIRTQHGKRLDEQAHDAQPQFDEFSYCGGVACHRVTGYGLQLTAWGMPLKIKHKYPFETGVAGVRDELAGRPRPLVYRHAIRDCLAA